MHNEANSFPKEGHAQNGALPWRRKAITSWKLLTLIKFGTNLFISMRRIV